MARKSLRYMNGLSITALVFVILTGIAFGVLAAVAFSGGQYLDQTVTIAADDFIVEEVSTFNNYFVNFWVESGWDVRINLFLLNDNQYAMWNGTGIPTDYERIYEVHEKFVYLQDETGWLVFYNSNSQDTRITYHFIELDDLQIPMMILGIICSIFLAILVLHTLGYFIKAFIIIPITGKTTVDRRKDDQDYYRHTPARPAPKAPKAPKGAVIAPVPPAAPALVETAPREPAINSISESFVVAGQAKTYHPTNKFLRGVERSWDYTSIPERILVLISIFFFLTGLVTLTWYLIVVLPIIFAGIALIVFFSGRNRREKLLRLVESHKAIYIYDAARILRTSPDFIRMDAWKIVRLGMGPVGFDPQNGILFDVTKVDPSKKKDLSPAAQTIHTQLLTEVDKKEEEKKEDTPKEIACPFCEEKSNPPDSAFCIKCGASLKPAK